MPRSAGGMLYHSQPEMLCSIISKSVSYGVLPRQKRQSDIYTVVTRNIKKIHSPEPMQVTYLLLLHSTRSEVVNIQKP